MVKKILILVVLLMGWAGVILFTKSKNPPPAEKNPVVVPAGPIPAASVQTASPAPTLQQPDLSAQQESAPVVTRDPFQTPPLLKAAIDQRRREAHPDVVAPTDSVAAQMPALTLQGLFWGGRRPQAIINRQIVSVGDTIEGVTITHITQDGVTLQFNGQESKLELPRRALENNASLTGSSP